MKRHTQLRETQANPLGWYFSQLEYCIDGSEDDLGSIIAYSVLFSAINFHLNTSSEQEYSYQETKAIYDGLEKTIEACKKGNVSQRFHELKQGVDTFLNTHLQMDSEDYDAGSLVKKIVSYLNNQQLNYQDSLRRKGLELRNLSPNLAFGQIKPNRRNILYDHNLIETIFDDSYKR